jgi:hypothetical protein
MLLNFPKNLPSNLKDFSKVNLRGCNDTFITSTLSPSKYA